MLIFASQLTLPTNQKNSQSMKKIYTLALFAAISALSASAVNDAPITLPEGVEAQQWVMNYDDMARMVNIAIDGNDIYLGNIDDENPDSYVLGTIADGKAVFPITYLGESATLEGPAYFVPTVWDTRYLEEIEDYWTDYFIEETYPFDYDAEGKVLTASNENSCFIVSSDIEVGALGGAFSHYYYEPTIRYVDPESANAPLADPELMTAYPMGDDEFIVDTIEFYIPSVNSEYYPLNTADVYYIFYVDGEPYTFTTDNYIGLEEDMTEIPYDFCDEINYDIYGMGEYHSVNLYHRGYADVGVKVFYHAPNGELLESALVEENIEVLSEGEIDKIETITYGEPVSTEYYNLSGMKVANPENGLFIKVETFKNGRRATKVVK